MKKIKHLDSGVAGLVAGEAVSEEKMTVRIKGDTANNAT
jgi:hypothetical protein